ncbi:MAG: 16S rRNA (adenine(1518)-N(6)/adenine(1519)-N(6))-dimethyltransferase RsmA [Armatimonadota bacterium]|nr:16S rRNA (adenine(1518)-N(6)/adenine(1519)-N(6))-dimethyltransferase RsmA [Armatimonadota bacterium]MDR7491368.1 16S rRNA (adenine(1518)-N(6)/adenine(1519)-N(6))-dimethyltransferase RsmA [Armatimonadota bacterium]MDR7502134.1 16S rRNA (adenine(1518)-N(6)/adenine(1519)-N(6))-dimethyltransferase RsmA [Armatimonadota bacterium]MDR7593118.1 16S rRNA (adenine(1518)-N(6)/adenine(1519)-N(6))-dimethyltransferase RsmA [Armatimonadota bacterium]
MATPGGTLRVLRAFGIRPRKRFGQHFLTSRHVLERIVREAAVGPGDRVLEVGAGIGTLTVALAATGAEVVAVEVDRTLLPALRAVTAAFPTVRLVEGDIMALDLAALAGPGPVTVAANLPYGIASPLLVRLLETLRHLRRAVVTVQAEVAGRLTAAPGTPEYGLLSVMVQYRARPTVVVRVPPGAFLPPPEVESAVVRLDPHPVPPVTVPDEAAFFAVVRAAFAQRRKTLRRALAALPDLAPERAEGALRRAGIDPRRRGETLGLEEFARLSRALAGGNGPRGGKEGGG